MLSDMPAKLAQDMHAACENGATIEALQLTIEEAVGGEIRTIKDDTKKAIRRAQG